MPIRAERVQHIISLATSAVEKARKAGKRLENLQNDMGRIQSRLNELGINDELLDDLVFNATTTARDGRFECQLDIDEVINLGKEQNWFEGNQSRHKNQATRMKMLRDGIRQREYKPRKNSSGKTTVPPAWVVEQMMKEELEERERIGKERHPEKGPCNSEVDGKCSWCEELESVLATAAKPVFDKIVQEIDPNLEFVPIPSARSEHIPLPDDEESWKPKGKKE